MTNTRIAVVGAGLIGRAHIQAIESNASLTLHAVVDPTPDAQALAARLGVPCHAQLQDLLTTHRPDGVVLATPNALHVPQAMDCIRAGLPCLVEKPVATTVAEARQLADQVQQHQVPVLVGHHRAHSPIMAQAREVIRSGHLGRLVGVMGSAVFYKPDGYFADAPWRTQPGGGPILINLIHEIHNLRMLCGEILAVQAFASHAVRQFAVEDTVAINFSFANGALGSFMLSDTAACAKSWEQTSQENPSYSTYPDEDCYVVMGTDGSLSIPTLRLRTHAQPQDRSWFNPMDAEQLDVPRQDPIALQMAHFGQVVRGEVQPLVSVQDGLANLQVTEAIAEAARSNRAVQVQDVIG